VLCSTPRHLATEADVDYTAKPINDYCRTKIEAERVALAANGVQNLVTTALRPQHLYGKTIFTFPWHSSALCVWLCASVRFVHCVCSVIVQGPYDPHAIKQGVLAVKTGQLKFRLGDGSARFGMVSCS